MNFIGIIPARYASSRFPGKPLADINGKPMVRLVYEKARETLSQVWVATDDQRIYDAVCSFGGKAVYTSPGHKSGTDRVAEAARIIEKETNFDIVINIQGDEPFFDPGKIDVLKSLFGKGAEIATLVRKVISEEELNDPNKPKVVLGAGGQALYFSRSPIPFLRDAEPGKWTSVADFWIHIGMYAYKKETLQEITKLQQGKLELAESLEQLRWLEKGYKIMTAATDSKSFGIDTPEDLKRALQLFS